MNGKRRRSFRIGEKLQIIVAKEVLRIGDSRFSLVTIASAIIAPDLKHAKIYWTVYGDEERKEEVKEAFEEWAPHFRKVVARELGIRFTPTVQFFYDNSLEVAGRMEEIFASIKKVDDPL